MTPEETRSKIRNALTAASNAPAGPERAAALREANELGKEAIKQMSDANQQRLFARSLGQEMGEIRNA